MAMLYARCGIEIRILFFEEKEDMTAPQPRFLRKTTIPPSLMLQSWHHGNIMSHVCFPLQHDPDHHTRGHATRRTAVDTHIHREHSSCSRLHQQHGHHNKSGFYPVSVATLAG